MQQAHAYRTSPHRYTQDVMDAIGLLWYTRPMLKRLPMMGLYLIFSAFTACSTGPDLDLLLHESERGSVYLERIPDRSFRAAHPIRIKAEVLARVLEGTRVRDQQGVLQELLAGKPDEFRAFSDKDVSYLAPLLAEGLSHAASDQQITFRVIQTAESRSTAKSGFGAEAQATHLSTSGSIYAYGQSLYLTLHQFRHPLGAVATTNPQRGLPNNTSLAGRVVTFSPEAAQTPESDRHGRTTASTLVIDYERLASFSLSPLPTTHPEPVSAPASVGSTQPSDPDASRESSEIETLRKELQDIKRQLGEQEADRKKSLPRVP